MRSLYSPDHQPTPDEREEAIRMIYDDGKVGFLVEYPGTILSQINTKQLQFFYLFVNPILLSKQSIELEMAKEVFARYIDLNLIF